MKQFLIKIGEGERVIKEFKKKSSHTVVTDRRFVFEDGTVSFSVALGSISTVLLIRKGASKGKLRLLADDGGDLLDFLNKSSIDYAGEETITELMTILSDVVAKNREKV